MRRFAVSLFAVSALMLFSGPTWAHHKPDHNPPGLNKLDAPTGLTCTPDAAGVVVNFAAVEGAGGYQVEYSCLDAAGLPVEESVFIEAPPTSEVPAECVVVLAVHARATPGVGPAGMKGEWSDPVTCQAI